MSEKRQLIPLIGLFATIAGAVYMAVQLSGQAATSTGDFTNATVAEVRNAQGQPVLSGFFQLADEEDDDIERRAVLAPTAVDADAAGEAEVEFSKNAPAEQEVEFSVRNVAPNQEFTFVIDSAVIGTATADARGRAEIELDIRMPAKAAAP
jgi:hypothetical protein